MQPGRLPVLGSLIARNNMSDFMAVILIGYIQCGLLLVWYLFHRRVVGIRSDFGSGQAKQDHSLRELENVVAEIRRQMRELAGQRTRGTLQGDSPLLKQAKRRGALEMARRGMDISHIAETLNIRRAEVEMLVRIERLQRNAEPAPADADRHWLETAS
jgi:hypothetical protein